MHIQTKNTVNHWKKDSLSVCSLGAQIEKRDEWMEKREKSRARRVERG